MLNRLYLLLYLSLCFSAVTFAQGTLNYALPIDGAGTPNAETGRAICNDASGNIYVCGVFNSTGGSTDFDITAGGSNTYTSSSSNDGYLVSYDKNGNFRWKVIFTGTLGDFGAPSGNVCTNGTYVWVTGTVNTNGTPVVIDGPGNSTGISTATGGAGVDVVVGKFSCSNGLKQWVQCFGGAGSADYGEGLCVDPSGNCYVSGSYSGSFTLGSITSNAPGGTSDFFVAKFDASGSILAFNNGGATANTDAIGIGAGLCYVPGGTPKLVAVAHTGASSANFGSITGLANSGGNDCFIAELDLSLNFLSAQVFGSTANDELVSVAYDPITGGVFACGYIGGNATVPGVSSLTGLGQQDIIIGRYSTSTHNFVWAKNPGGAGFDRGWSIIADGQGGIIMGGSSASAPCNFGSQSFSANGGALNDLYIIRYNASGTPVWLYSGGGTASEEIRSVSSYVSGGVQTIFAYGNDQGSFTLGSTSIANDGGNDFLLLSLNDASAPLSATQSQVNLTCNGVCTGSATVVASGGTAPYTYSWSPSGGSGATASSLCAINYTVNITDAASNSITKTFSITQPPAIVITPISQTNIACNGGATGAAQVTASGGTGPLTYNWTPGNPTGDGTGSVTGLTAGVWTVTLADANSCTATRTFNITQPTALAVNPLSQTNIACNGGSTGAASVTVSGGTPGYTYNWTPGNPTGDGTASVTGLTAGVWTANITDANGCTGTRTFNLTQPPALTVNALSQTNVSCNGGNNGAASVSVSGGTGPYIYDWTPGNPTGDGTASVTGLSAQTYTVSVQDANGCTGTRTFNITSPPALNVNPVSQTNVACNGGTNGAASVNVSGGVGGYTYDWTPGNPTGDGTASVTGLSAQTYTVSVQDANGCTGTRTFNITSPTALTVNPVSQTNVACFGGTTGAASVSVSGGAGGYTYDWTPGNPTGDGTTSVTGLSAGVWTVAVTDANSCTGTRTFNITSPTALTVNPVSQTNVACFGGTTGAASVSVSGGAGGYTYNWTPGNPTGDGTASVTGLSAGVWTVVVTDANSCTGTSTFNITSPTALTVNPVSQTNVACNGGTTGAASVSVSGGAGGYTYNWTPGNPTGDGTASVTGLSAGVWTVVVTDANSCTGTRTFNITSPTALTVNPVSQTNVACNGGTTGAASVSVSGGAGGYTYNWTPGNPTGDGTASVTGLSAGVWTVVVTDANSCTGTRTFNVTAPSALTVTPVSQTNVACNGGTTGAASVSVSGGAGGYTYNWTPGNPAGDGTASVTGLSAGVWTVVVTDANSCTGTSTFNITSPLALTVTPVSQTNVACFGGTTGAASVSVSGGAGGYTYNWTPGNPTGDGTASVTGLSAGVWTVVVTDANSCTGTRTFNITEPTTLSASISHIDVSCFAGSNGSATVSASEGTTPYFYSWSPSGGTGAIATGLTAGTYTVVVTDANSCTTSQTATVAEPAMLSATVGSVTDNACSTSANGVVNVDVSGGTTTYTYNWSNGATTEDLSGLTAGTYNLTVTDAHNCTASLSATVTAPQALAPTFSITQVGCNGDNTGAVDLSISGGILPYSYNWNNGQTTQDINNLTAGVYTVTITDDNSCSISASATVSQPAILAASALAGNITCNGADNGTINLTVTGGTTTYTYTWSNGSVTEDLNGLTTGTYTVTVTDANSCTASASATITEPGVLTASAQATHVSCNAGSNGTIDVTVAGGTTAYTFNWSNGAVTEDLNGLTAGTYTITVTDANSCTASASATVTEPAVLAATTQVTGVNCNGGSNGAVDLTVTGGTTTYTYAWSTGAITEDLSNLMAGTYTVTVMDANSCSVSASATVTEPAVLTASAQGTDVSCHGGNNGSVDVTVTGGTVVYTYAWSNSATTEDLNTLTAGTYAVTVTDAHSCTASASAEITEPTLLTAGAQATAVSCNGGSNGAVDLTVNGGTTNYTYAWSNGAITEDVSGLTAAIYMVTVTDANSCTASASATVTEPAVLSASVQPANVSCNGGSNGAADLTVTGGTTAYTFAWSTAATTEDITGLTAGTYVVTVTDANSCTASASVTITEPAVLTASVLATNVGCHGDNTGAIDLTVAGGTTAYLYSWSNGAITEDLINITAGAYTVTVTDANGCTTTASATITEPLALTATAQATDVSCNGGSNGAIDATVSGGTTAYTYTWSNGAVSEDITGLTSGTYVLTITDAQSCSITVSATVNQPAALTATAQATNVGCNGGSDGAADLTVNGGTTAYTYAWSTSETTEDVNGLAAGTYTVTVTDANSCTVSASVTITEPALLTASVQASDVSCYGGTNGAVDLTVSGGTAAYVYTWSNGATTEDINGLSLGLYAVTVTDAHSCSVTAVATVTEPTALTAGVVVTAQVSCNGGSNGAVNLTVNGGTTAYTYNWSNGATTEDISGLSAGNYAVTVTDAHSCTVAVLAQVTEPAALSVNATTTDVTCNGSSNGGIDITVTGGVTTYAYTWSNGAITEDVSGLNPGLYTVTVTDANSCTATASATITEPAVLTASIQATNVSCNGGSNGAADLTVSGGTAAYSYAWSNGAVTEDLNGLSVGTYTVTVTDVHNCPATATVNITEPALLTVTAQATPVSCNSGSNGAVDVTVNGGTAGYVYNWSNGATVQNLTVLSAGNYTLTVTDANSCTATVSATVTEPAALTATTGVTSVTCNGAANGAVDLTVNGGTVAYTYNWSNGATTEDLTGVAGGTYTVTVTDANNCSTTVAGTVAEPAALTVQAQTTNLPCHGDNTGAVDLTVSGGTTAYTFAWSNGAGTEDIASLVAGNYSVTITDANSCSASFAATVTEPTALTLTLQTTPASCSAGANGAIDLTANGGTGAFTYNWNNGSTQQDLTGLTVDTYTVTVVDANSCSASASAAVAFVFNSPTVNLGADVTQCGGSVSLDAGSGGFTYVWNTGSNAQTVAVTSSGTYSVVVTDANSCTGTDTVEVTIHLLPQVTITPFADTLCSNASAITLSGAPAGGTFSGTGVSGSNFNPQTAGNGWHTIQYAYTDGNNCSANATDSVYVELCSGLPVVSNDLLFEYYPNPNNGSFVVRTTEADEVSIQLVNAAGQLVVQTLLTQSNNHTAHIEELPAGVYLITCSAGNRSISKKVVVIR